MYCSRPATRSPSTIRIISHAAPRRQASFFPGFPVSPFYHRTASIDPFRSFEKVFDELASPQFPFAPQQLTRQQSYQPRFDVRENNGTYELRGEVPGVESRDLEVEFADAQTLIVRGRTESEASSGTPPQAVQSEKGKEHATDTAVATEGVPENDNSDTASIHSTGSYQKPSVEDATEPANDTAASSEAQNTPATTPGAEPTANTIATAAQPDAPAQTTSQQQQGHYWVSERSTGSFQRTFKFPHRVDQEAVTASLKNGILNIVVPKAAKPEPRRIQVE